MSEAFGHVLPIADILDILDPTPYPDQRESEEECEAKPESDEDDAP